MGNACSQSYVSKFQPQLYEVDINDFKKMYRSFKFPKNISFTHDPKLFRIRYLPTNEPRILKRLTFDDEKQVYRFMFHLLQIVRFDHENLLKIYHFSMERNELKDRTISYTLNVVLENFDHTLYDELVWRKQAMEVFSANEVQSFVENMSDALEFLQLKQFSHGNVRPSNIYITSNKQYKLMFIGNLPIEHTTGKHYLCEGTAQYLSPQKQSKMVQGLFSNKISLLSSSVPRMGFNPWKADIFSLGLVTLEMMSMRDIEGLNEIGCEEKRQYRISECSQHHIPSLCNLVETMLYDSEQNRPDWIDLKRMIILEEYIGFKKANPNLKPQQRQDGRGKIEMKTIKNKSEIYVSPEYYLPSSGESEISMFMEMNEEAPEKKGDHGTISTISRDLSPTKAYTERHESNGKKFLGEEILSGDEWEEEKGELIFKKDDEMFIESEEAFEAAKLHPLKKLVINLEEKSFNKDTIQMLSELLSSQTSLNELVLALPKEKFGDEGLELICQGLSKLNEMSLCFLDLRKNKITDAGVSYLTEGLPEKKRLEQLGLNLSDNRITQEGCKTVSSWFGELESVKSLALNLGGNKFGNQGTAIIGREFGKLKNLESFVLFLYLNEIEGKEGLKVLFDGLKEMENLKKLKVDFSGNLLGDEDMDAIKEFLEKCEVEEILLDLKDNCLSQKKKEELEMEAAKRERVRVAF